MALVITGNDEVVETNPKNIRSDITLDIYSRSINTNKTDSVSSMAPKTNKNNATNR